METEREVDSAMIRMRPPKITVRSLWLDIIKEVFEDDNENVPKYLTLPGSEGFDIQMLIDHGIVSLTEVGAIAEEYHSLLIAVERSDNAVINLKRKFPGLKVRETDFSNIVHSDSITGWPQGDDRNLCRAKIVNLDLNNHFEATISDGNISFPLITWIHKISRIHTIEPRIDWFLFLTLHAEILWPGDVVTYVGEFLHENLHRDESFLDDCRTFLGDEVINLIIEDRNLNLSELSFDEQQKVIMVLVPKIIARDVHNDGWEFAVDYNLRYGGGDTAPMVTWIFRFNWNEELQATPDRAYRIALQKILENPGYIDSEGNISSDI